jgi:endonuclease/exonuclease/phosphatase (EEP) superfamily protein YafD
VPSSNTHGWSLKKVMPCGSLPFGIWRNETWPCGLPLLSIDHIWVGPDWQVIKADKFWRLTGSDHAALLVTVRRKPKIP